MSRKQIQTLCRILAGAALLLAAVLIPARGILRLLLFLVPYLLAGGDVLWRALRNILRGQVFDENFLMAVATIGAFCIGEYPEAVLVMVFYQVGEWFQGYAVGRSRSSIAALMDIRPDHANLETPDGLRQADPEEIAVGDVIVVKSGERIPLDGTVLEGRSTVDTAALTGESVPVEKNAAAAIENIASLGDRVNMIYSGCAVSYGRGRAVVVETGMDTEMGKIATMLENEDEGVTPLQLKLAQLGKYLGFLALGICAVIFVVGLLDGMNWLDMFMTAVSLAVAAIPEGLPAIVTIVLAIGVQRMVAKNAIIRRLPAVETLGSASVICSDKTGTLTQNRMTLVKAYAGDRLHDLDGDIPEGVRALIRLATLCTDGSVRVVDGEEKHLGDPTETAIVACALHHGMDKDALTAEHPRLGEIPFDSDRKLMTTINLIEGKNVVIVKGAPDILLQRCVSGHMEAAAAANEEMGRDALRVLAIGYKYIDDLPVECRPEELEKDLIFVGLVGMIDPPRPEATAAIRECDSAGIRTVMITGDHVVTASAIARELGILQDDSEAITGAELAAMSDDELFENIRKYRVYARVTPTDKIRIVKAWQRAGEIVSMTGDGVNDAPALKAADIGCAMGITGTDVAKGAADMTLTDDNFATIVDAVKEGRGIYDNIKKAVGFLLGTNIGEILTVFFAMIFWRQTPLLSMQLLWINLVTDSLPAIAIGMEPVESNVMDRKPKPKDESIFANGMGVRIGLQGILFAGLTLFGFWLGQRVTGGLIGGQTLAFMILALSQVFHAFNMRSNMSLFKVGVFSNRNMNKAALVSLVLMAIVLFVPPVASVFGLTQLPVWLYLVGLGCSLVSIPILEFTKAMGWHKA